MKKRKKHHYYDYMDHGIFFASMVYHSLYCVFTVLIFTIDPCLTKSQEIIPQILDILQSQKKRKLGFHYLAGLRLWEK